MLMMIIPAIDGPIGDEQRAVRFDIKHTPLDVLVASSSEANEIADLKRFSHVIAHLNSKLNIVLISLHYDRYSDDYAYCFAIVR